MQRILTMLGHDTGMKVVPSDDNTKFGVITSDCEMVLPFEFDYIDNIMPSNGVIMAKNGDTKILIEL